MDVLCIQHEFGIYAGPAGSHLLALLKAVLSLWLAGFAGRPKAFVPCVRGAVRPAHTGDFLSPHDVPYAYSKIQLTRAFATTIVVAMGRKKPIGIGEIINDRREEIDLRLQAGGPGDSR